MAIEDRAQRYVTRADQALNDLGRADEIWADSVHSTSDEMLVHRLPIALDKAIREVEGPFESWCRLEPAVVTQVAEHGPVKLFQLLSSHPNGHVREAFVRVASALPNETALPHLTNRAVEFVPAIGELAGREVRARLAFEMSRRSQPGPHGVLPTAIHISLTKLLLPRTAVLDPDLLRASIELARTTTASRPGRLAEHALERMRYRCDQTAMAVPDAAGAIRELVSFFEESSAS